MFESLAALPISAAAMYGLRLLYLHSLERRGADPRHIERMGELTRALPVPSRRDDRG